MVKLIIFDWDDVFTLGSKEGYFKCYHEALVAVGVHLDPEEEKKRILAKWGSSHVEEIKELLKDSPELIEKTCGVYERHLFGDTFVDCLKVLPGTQTLLGKLSKKYVLALATGASPKLLKEKVLPKFHFPDVFSQIITGYDLDDMNHSKPHQYMVMEIMKAQNVEHFETIVVGDAKNDVLMAQNAGVTPVVVLTGHLNRKEAEELKVKYIIEDVTQIEQVLNQLN